MLVRMFGKVISLVMPWEIILGYVIQLASSLLKEWLKTMTYTKKGKYFTMTVYVLCEALGEELVADTRTNVDDTLLQGVINLCEEMAERGEFKLPVVPEV
jgi:hypothetical protein